MARLTSAYEVDAVDQPWPASGPGTDQGGHRDGFGALRGDLHDERVATRQPQALTCLALKAEPRCPGPPPSFYDGPLLVLPGSDSRLVPLGGFAVRILYAPADAVQRQIEPGQGVVDAEPAAHGLGDPRQRPALVAPTTCGRAGFQHCFQSTQVTSVEVVACAARARRQRFAESGSP
jgi:hypothetical protein